jgi:hypothetical protein
VSQSPENGSRPCKSGAEEPDSPIYRQIAGRNPLKTGLVPARIEILALIAIAILIVAIP